MATRRPRGHSSVFRRLHADLESGKLRSRKRLSEEELAAMRHMMSTTKPGDRRRYVVKEILNEVVQTKNPDWFE